MAMLVLTILLTMIITPVRIPYKTIIVIFAVFLLLAVPAALYGEREITVLRVLDGDTIDLEDGIRVRLLGLDTPEKGEYLADVSRDWLTGMIGRKGVNLSKCDEKDRFGRTLAIVMREGININLELLAQGLAVPMLIPPCGRSISIQVLEMAARALKGKKGLYASDEYTVIDHAKAGEYIGKKVVVAGMIRDIHKSEKAVQLNFGVDWRTDFTAVIFRDSLERFGSLDLDLDKFKGRFVFVMGRVKEYNGPEIIVRWPTQILPLPVETSP